MKANSMLGVATDFSRSSVQVAVPRVQDFVCDSPLAMPQDPTKTTSTLLGLVPSSGYLLRIFGIRGGPNTARQRPQVLWNQHPLQASLVKRRICTYPWKQNIQDTVQAKKHHAQVVAKPELWAAVAISSPA